VAAVAVPFAPAVAVVVVVVVTTHAHTYSVFADPKSDLSRRRSGHGEHRDGGESI
jgi:hypothetical protein